MKLLTRKIILRIRLLLLICLRMKMAIPENTSRIRRTQSQIMGVGRRHRQHHNRRTAQDISVTGAVQR